MDILSISAFFFQSQSNIKIRFIFPTLTGCPQVTPSLVRLELIPKYSHLDVETGKSVGHYLNLCVFFFFQSQSNIQIRFIFPTLTGCPKVTPSLLRLELISKYSLLDVKTGKSVGNSLNLCVFFLIPLKYSNSSYFPNFDGMPSGHTFSCAA